jgi:hypothetical protein
MSAAVSGGSSPITGGTLYFCDSIARNCMLSPTATAQVVNGTAIFKTVLGVGSYNFTAIYAPATGYSASTSPAVTLTVPFSTVPTFQTSPLHGLGANYSLNTSVSVPTLTTPTGTVTVTDTTAGIQLASLALSASPTSVNATLATQPTVDPRGVCTTVTGDFNGDGHPDIAFGFGCKSADGLNTAIALQILLGNGDGSFTAGPIVPTAMTNTNVIALTVGDFNNDGTLDLIATDNQASSGGTTSTSHFYLLANDGTAHFTATQIGSGCITPQLATSDLNRDGNLDFVANCDDTLNVFLGNGAGVFSQTSTHVSPLPIGLSPTTDAQNTFAIADFNNDGYPDLVTTAPQVFLNTGTGTNFTQVTSNSTPFVTNVIAGDFNGDGNADFIAFEPTWPERNPYGTNIYSFFGDGTGAFTAGPVGNIGGPTTAGGPISAFAADLNHDGITDYIAFVAGFPFSSVYSLSTSYFGGDGFTAGITDFNGDGIADYVIANSNPAQAQIYTTTGSAGATATLTPLYVLGSGTHDISVTYSGDTVYQAVNQHLNLAADKVGTTLYLSPPSTTIFVGSPAAITAQITPYSATIGPNTFTTNGQTVTFTSGGTTLGTATLINGTAVLNVSNLPLGQTSITASYAGDSTFKAVTSDALVVTAKDPHPPTVSPTAITFASIALDSNTPSDTQTVTFTNTTTSPLTITSIQVTGDGISQTNNCAAPLAVAASCTISLTSTPVNPGSVTGALTIHTNGITPTITVNLTAPAVIFILPQVTASPNPAVVHTPVTLTATYPATTHGLSTNGMTIHFSSFFSSYNDLGTAQLSNGVATLTLTNLQLGTGTIQATLFGNTNFTSTTGETTVTIVNQQYPTVTPNTVNFGSIPLGGSSTQNVTFSNTTISPLTVSAVNVTGGFTQTNNCGVVAASASCTATVTFTPSALGAANGTLTFTTNPNTSVNAASLTGTGVAFASTLHLASSSASTSLGTEVSLTATLTPYTNGSISSNGKSVTFTSGSTALGTATLNNGTAILNTAILPAGSNSITAAFTGDINFASATSNAANVTVAGVTPTLHLEASPTSASIGAPISLTATLTPYSAGSFSTNGKTISFTRGSAPLGTSMLNNGVAAISITNLPMGSNSITATFTGDTNFASATSNAATATISAPPAPTVSPTAVSFGAVRLNTPTSQTVTLTNTSAGPLTIASIAANSVFSQTNTCGSFLAAAASCTVTVNFTATSAAPATGTLAITTNASAPITTVPLSGSGIASTLNLTASPFSASLGTQVTLSATLTPYTNGSISSNGKSVTFTSGGSVLGTATLNNGTAVFNTSTLPVGNSTITATFTGDANFTSATSNSTTITVAGLATTLHLAASPTSASLGNQVALTATLTPYSAGTLTTNGKTVTFTSGGSILGTATLNNGTAVFNLTSLPLGSNSITASFTGDTNFASATSSAAVVTITSPTAPTVSPTSINFGAISLGSSVSQTVTLTNTAASSLIISAVQVTGGFTQTNTCGVLAVSASCTATVTFAPTAASTSDGTLTFTTNAVTPTTTVSLSGSGVTSVSGSSGGGTLGTIQTGASGSLPVSFTIAPGISGTLNTTCSVKISTGSTAIHPPTCSTAPSSLLVTGGSTVSTTVIITTTNTGATLRIPTSGIALAGGLLGLLAFLRRRPTFAALLLLLLSLTAIGSITGCGTSGSGTSSNNGGGSSSNGGGGGSSNGGGSATNSTTAGSYTVTVTGTIGTQTSSVDLPLTIQ